MLGAAATATPARKAAKKADDSFLLPAPATAASGYRTLGASAAKAGASPFGDRFQAGRAAAARPSLTNPYVQTLAQTTTSANRDQLWANKFDPSDSPEVQARKRAEMKNLKQNPLVSTPSKGSTAKKIDSLVGQAYKAPEDRAGAKLQKEALIRKEL